MEKSNSVKQTKNRILATVLVAVLLFSLVSLLIKQTYTNAKKNGFNNLHINTKEVKEDLELQMVSDRENLVTMANFAAKLHSDGESYDILLRSFKSIGLIENIGILLPDNTFLSVLGKADVTGKINFREEAEKGSYISGRTKDIMHENNEVIRSSVPIEVNGKVVGILYGVIDLESLKKRMEENASVEKTQIFVIDRENGNMIVDTISKKLGNISLLQSRKFIDNYTYEELRDNVLGGGKGFSAFESKTIKGTTFYLHYSPLKFSNWEIILAEPEKSVFSEARETRNLLVVMFSGIVFIMSAYLAYIFLTERRAGKLHKCTSEMRRLLLDINNHQESVEEALETMVVFSSAGSAFFVDNDGEVHHFIAESKDRINLNDADRSYLISRLLNYAKKRSRRARAAVGIISIFADSVLKRLEPEFYDFMVRKNVRNIIFSAIVKEEHDISILGVLNPKKSNGVYMLLEDVSICFSMAIFNRKYLEKTEVIAATDALTGLFNRSAYKRDLRKNDEINLKNFSCVYIDVNELHVINNKYGHATGDAMLLFVANTLKEVFRGNNIYRIGGDEFLVFTYNTPEEDVQQAIAKLVEKVEEMNYHISVGMHFCAENTDISEVVSQAEKKMYEAKARYYQQKESRVLAEVLDEDIYRIATGVRELDSLLEIISRRYHGIYGVSLKTGKARSILMPAYLKTFSENDELFEDAFLYYVQEMVAPDYQRAMSAFLNYEALLHQIEKGEIPSIEYSKVNGENVVLSVYPAPGEEKELSDTIWIFENQR